MRKFFGLTIENIAYLVQYSTLSKSSKIEIHDHPAVIKNFFLSSFG